MSSKEDQLREMMTYLWQNYPDQLGENLSDRYIAFWYQFIQGKGQIQGAGLMDMFKRTLKIAKSIPYRAKALLTLKPRDNNPTGRLKRWMNENKGKKIVSIDVGRVPLSSGVQTAMNILSLGNFSRTANQLDYDSIFHQYMIVKFDDGSIYKLEKNAVIEQGTPSEKEINNIKVSIPIKKALSIDELMKNASYNDDMFYKYDPSRANCQIFCKNVVDRNGLLPTIDTAKVLETQDSQKLVNSLPYPLRNIPLVITNLGSVFDKVIYGEGIKNTPENFIQARLIVDGLI